MKHAGGATLEALSGLLEQVRRREGVKEKKLGVFYRKSKAFMHFHEDPAGMFADLTVGAGFERHPVNDAREWELFLERVDRVLAG